MRFRQEWLWERVSGMHRAGRLGGSGFQWMLKSNSTTTPLIPLAERPELDFVIQRQEFEEADARRFRGLGEAAQRGGSRDRAGRKENPSAPSHSITLSVRSRRRCGIATPSAAAVRMFNSNSNLSGCSTGKSLGRAPFRMRAARRPSWRYSTLRRGP